MPRFKFGLLLGQTRQESLKLWPDILSRLRNKRTGYLLESERKIPPILSLHNKQKNPIYFFFRLCKFKKSTYLRLFGNISLFGSLEYFGASFKTCMIFTDHVTTPLYTLNSKVFLKLHLHFLMQIFRGFWVKPLARAPTERISQRFHRHLLKLQFRCHIDTTWWR